LATTRDDVTYSGTVAAAFEGLLLGIPGIAVPRGAHRLGQHFRHGPTTSAPAEFGRLVASVIAHGPRARC
jgi:broad specificity polyphosphatase/5'/3'-nucleotidase SurE